MTTSFKASEVRTAGEKGTYRTTLGGTGLGYRFGGEVVRDGENGFYYPVDGLESFDADNGVGYMRAIRGLALPPAYTR